MYTGKKGKKIKMDQRTKAESDPAVAAASILARRPSGRCRRQVAAEDLGGRRKPGLQHQQGTPVAQLHRADALCRHGHAGRGEENVLAQRAELRQGREKQAPEARVVGDLAREALHSIAD